MNGAAVEQSIRELQGADFEPEDEAYPYPGLIISGLVIAAWAIFGGAAWCLYRAVEAIAG